MLCDDLEGWDREGGKEAQKGGGMYTLISDLHCCIAETSTTQHCKPTILQLKENNNNTDPTHGREKGNPI